MADWDTMMNYIFSSTDEKNQYPETANFPELVASIDSMKAEIMKFTTRCECYVKPAAG
jgi:hypothetical protein